MNAVWNIPRAPTQLLASPGPRPGSCPAGHGIIAATALAQLGQDPAGILGRPPRRLPGAQPAAAARAFRS
jgi:hypothetical protein